MFDSLEGLCKEFGFERGLSRAKLRSEIKKRMLSIHSDKTGGDFPNEAIKQLYLRMQEALRYLEVPAKSVALQKQNLETSALEQRIAALENRSESRGPLLEESTQRTNEAAGKYYRTWWVSSAIFAAICGAILPFSQSLSKNPMFSTFTNALWLRTILAAVFIASGVAFLAIRSKELMLKSKVSAILSEDGIAWTLRQCVHNYKDEDDPHCEITQRKLMDAIQRFGTRWHKSRFVRWLGERLGAKIPRDVAGEIAKAQISCLTERGVLQRQGNRAVEPLYMISSALAKEISDDPGASMSEHNFG